MVRLLRGILDRIEDAVAKHPAVHRVFHPPLEALDNFFLRKPETTTGAPHLRDALDLKRYMIAVVVALMPAVLLSIYLFGWRVVAIIFVSYLFGVSTEWIFAAVRQEEINEGAFVTCMIYPLILPPTIPLWMVAVGIVFGIVFGKEAFGGTGRNIFNPAMVGRIFLAIAFPSAMTTQWQLPFQSGLGGFLAYSSDAVTSATPLMTFKGTGGIASTIHLLLGTVPGCLGETSKLLLLLGGLFLMVTKVSNWRLPVSYLSTVLVFSGIASAIWPETSASPSFHLLSGGLLFGAMFMATDPVTCPFTRMGKWIYGVGLGVLTMLIRTRSGYVEGVMFAVIFMNIFAPLIDHVVLSVRYRQKRLEATVSDT